MKRLREEDGVELADEDDDEAGWAGWDIHRTGWARDVRCAGTWEGQDGSGRQEYRRRLEVEVRLLPWRDEKDSERSAHSGYI